MTAQTPAPKAGGASTLLASLSTVPPPTPSVKNDFLAVMLQALIGGADGTEQPAQTQPGAQAKASPAPAVAPDPTAASLLLALLTPPQPTLPKQPSRKTSGSEVPSALASQKKPSPADAADAAPDLTAAGLLLALLAPPLPVPPKPSSPKGSTHCAPAAPSGPEGPLAPAAVAGETKAAKPDAAAKPLPPPASPPPIPTIKEQENKPPLTSGTSVANPNQRMSFLSERNEIAGRTEQKLPITAISGVSSADADGSSPDGGAKSSLAFSWHDAPTEPLAIIDLSAKAAGPAAPVADILVDAPVRAASTAPLERLEQMISREAVNVRQAGAESLGVMLKLDTNTQLFLQLTTHNGMVQASVRCERGNFAPEDAQWAQLQQSLARQNVELLPMTGGSNLNFQQSSQERPRYPEAREEWPGADAAVPPAQPRQQQKEQKRSRQTWESWA